MDSPASQLPALDFASRNTPLQAADRLAAQLGLQPGQLWIKRDDLTGLVGGGNKARKLELLIADAINAGADTIVTGGAAQSNHVRATAAAARHAGLRCIAVLADDEPPAKAEGNLILDDLLGAEVLWTNRTDRHDAFDAIVEELVESGSVPYAVPLGGSSPLGAAAYTLCAEEISAKLGSGVTVVCAVGSGGTMAGLVAGLGPQDTVLGFDVLASPAMNDKIGPLIEATGSLLGRAPTSAWDLIPTLNGLTYGAPSSEVFDAIRLVAHNQGLILDPVYSGRAMAGFIHHMSAAPIEGPVVFLHTGGLPAIFIERFDTHVGMPAAPKVQLNDKSV